MLGAKRLFLTGFALLSAGFFAVPQAKADGQHEFMFMPSVDVVEVYDKSEDDVAESDTRATADVLYSYTAERFRLLGEYLLSSDESELERLQVGWSLSDDVMLWFGRFHSPASFWVSEFHHGQYLQTSITRPSLEQWEDESGAAPAHLSGLNLDIHHELNSESALNWSIAAGFAPKFVGEELVPFDILDPDSGYGLSLSGRVSFHPDMFQPVQFGLLSSWNKFNVEPAQNPGLVDLSHIDQLTFGFFAHLEWGDFRLISSTVYHQNDLHYASGRVSDDYLLTYVQPEYSVNDDIVVFGRVDIGSGEDESVYLNLLPAFKAHRNMLGVRWDFAKSQGLTFEIADVARQGETARHLTYKEVRVQWSAVVR